MTDGGDGERWWPAWLGAALVLVALVVFLQQFSRGLHEATLERAPTARINSERLTDPGVAPLTVTSKFAAKAAYYERTEQELTSLHTQEAMDEIDSLAVSRPDRLRAAIMAGELMSKDQAQARLAKLATEATPDGDLARELHWLRVLYADGRAAVPDEAQQSLIDRHGWFGSLALSHGMPDGDRYRRSLLGGIEKVGVFTLWVLGLVALAFVIGLFALGALISGYRQGVLRRGFEEGFAPVIHLETFTVFAGGFLILLGLGLVPFGMGAEASVGALVFHEFLLWSLVGVMAWPLIRQVPWREFAEQAGLTLPERPLAEVGYGVLGFTANLPLFVGAVFVSAWVESAMSGDDSEGAAGSHPLFEPPEVGSEILLFLGTLSALVWAPIIEECVFRGVLYRWTRRWAAPWLAIGITAIVFGLIHPYTPAGLIPVAVGGLTMGALREWRGSLIAPMTCHFLHNATISAMTIGYLVALNG